MQGNHRYDGLPPGSLPPGYPGMPRVRGLPPRPTPGPQCSVAYSYGKRCPNTTQANAGHPWLVCSMHMESFAAHHNAQVAKFRAELRAQNPPTPPPPKTHWVYYVQMPGDLIKIGTTTQIRQRMNGLTAKSEDLLAVEPGDRSVEAQRHKTFAHLRWRRSERFRDDPVLRAHIEAVRAEHGRPVLTQTHFALQKAQPSYLA